MTAIKIAAIGDSITYGYPYLPDSSWFNLAAQRLRFDYVNSGVNGDTTGGMLSRFSEDVLNHRPSYVIIMGGTNDAYMGFKAGHVLNTIRSMVETALDNGIVPIIGLPIPCNDQMEESLLSQYRADMQEHAVSRGIGYIDFYTAMRDESGSAIKEGLYCDGVHPNTAGYQIMADAAVEQLKVLIL